MLPREKKKGGKAHTSAVTLLLSRALARAIAPAAPMLLLFSLIGAQDEDVGARRREQRRVGAK